MRALLLFIIITAATNLQAQTDSTAASDSTKAARKHIYKGPRTASILSAVIPGAGQVYNRKYWKVPVIYAALGGLGYLFYVHNDDYNYFRRNLAAIHDKNEATENVTPYSSDQLVLLKRDSRKLRDLSIVGLAAVYLLNIMDANVDAHLKTFDVIDDLSLRLRPFGGMMANHPAAGISLTLNYR